MQQGRACSKKSGYVIGFKIFWYIVNNEWSTVIDYS